MCILLNFAFALYIMASYHYGKAFLASYLQHLIYSQNHFFSFILGPTFAENSGNFEQKVGGSGSMKHLPIELESGEKSQKCCGENEICSHVKLMWNYIATFFFFIISIFNLNIIFSDSDIFKLKWRRKSKKYDQHKHDIVSFEKGNITTTEHSSKRWETPPQTMLILIKSNSTSVQILCAEMLRYYDFNNIVFLKGYFFELMHYIVVYYYLQYFFELLI
uniref:Uncharacterized protein n=1 Tax=Lactuca sativa TaxID=4236 RepID=A0A9R1UZK6_LACSA|nr:hypothetical protein LSAT_V11C700379200 [Lactuca sativa]